MLVNHSQCFTAVKYDYVNQNGSKRRFYLIEDWKYLRLGPISFVKHSTEPVFFIAADTNETGGQKCWHEDYLCLTRGKGWPVH